MSIPKKSFHQVAFSALLKAQWGKDYDPELMATLKLLDDAEQFVKLDWEAIEKDIQAGKLTREWWNRDLAERDLKESRDSLNAIQEELVKSHGAREASRIIEAHYNRREEWEKDQKQAKPEWAMTAWLLDCLTQCDGQAPTDHAKIDNLIDALKYYAKAFDEGISHEEKKMICNSKIARPIEEYAEQRAKRQHPNDYDEWRIIYLKEMHQAAMRIATDNLFPASKTQSRKITRPMGLPIGSKRNASS